ncbi:MAG: polymerase sigma factor, sigma-70 family [Gemmatimonadetes bacterium]|nr:polymerase sigma factor, sigma-70 family [Gemmatimonadota bacterium]
MTERQDCASLLVQHLGWIERVAASLSRRNGLSGDEAEDFASWAKAKLVEDDYAVLRKFRGESALTTYLTVVLTMLYRDYRVAQWGRWRPSAAAKRRGPAAVRLETLVYRDGYRWRQAADLMHSRGETDLSEDELGKLLADLPAGSRGRPRQVGEAAMAAITDGADAEAGVHAAEAEQERQALGTALARAMQGLNDEDRAILRMRFWQGYSVADVARAMRLDQKPLYRRIDRLLSRLRTELEKAGISRERVRVLTDEDAA